MKAAGLASVVTGKAGDDVLEKNYQAIVANPNIKGDTSYSSPLWSGLAGISYFMILGLFTVFGIMVYSSGFLIIVITYALPLIIGMCAFGSFTPLLSVSKIGLAAILSIILLPITVGVMSKVMLTTPIQTMNSSLDFAIKESTDRIAAYEQRIDKCRALSRDDCVAAGKDLVVGAVTDYNGGGIVKDAVIGLGLGAFAVIAAFAVAVTQVRRIPALVFQVLGASGGGGESSGAYSPPGVVSTGQAAIGAATSVAKVASGLPPGKVGGGGGAGGSGAPALPSSARVTPQTGPSARTITVTQEPKNRSSGPQALPYRK